MKCFNWLSASHKQAKQVFLAFWHKRQKRERFILLLGFCFVIIIAIDVGIWQPLTSYQSRVIAQYTKFQSNLPYIARTLVTYEYLKNSGQMSHLSTKEPLQSKISQMLAAQQVVPFGIKVKILNPKRAVLTFKQVPFDSLMQGVESLNKQALFVVKSDIQKVNNKGIVKGQLTLSQFR